MNDLISDFADKIEKANVRIVFGLEKQGHIATIERMLEQSGNTEYTWLKIGKEIGWCHKTAAYHYIDYLLKKISTK